MLRIVWCISIVGCLGPISAFAQTAEATLLEWIAEATQWDDRSDVIDTNARPAFRNLAPAQMEARLQYWEALSQRVDSLAAHLTTVEGRINYRVFRYVLDDELSHYRFQYYLVPLNAEGGFLTALGYLPGRTRLRGKDDWEEYHSKLVELPRYLKQQRDWLETGRRQGITLPAVLLPNVLEVLDNLISEDAQSSLFYTPVAAAQTEDDTNTERLVTTLRTQVLPALHRFRHYLTNDYGPSCRSTIGMAHLPRGRAMYQERVRHFTTLDMQPEAVAERGKTEVARIRSEMEAIIADLDFAGDFSEFLSFLRTDPQFYAAEPEALLKEAAWISKRIEGQLPAYFGTLPRQPFTVAPVPDAIAPRYTGGRYVPGNPKAGYPGTYWVNTYDLASRPLYVLPALSLHEAVPGHHLQMALTRELSELPDFRRRLYISAFGEGWALYGERLGKEMGIYRTPYEDFGRLTYEMWRACRLVVDVGMHYQDMSRAEAVQFMTENTALSLHEINTEIDRYIGWPGQALSYKIGELYIRDLRQAMESELGEAFSLSAFHDAILSSGTLPLPILGEVVRTALVADR